MVTIVPALGRGVRWKKGPCVTKSLSCIVILAAAAAACSGGGSDLPTSPTLGGMLAPLGGVMASIESGTRAIGPELQVQSCSQERSLRATATSVRTQIEFVNLTGSIKSLYWIGYNGERYLFSTMLNEWSYT